MSLSLAQLRQLVALADAGSIGAAARALGVSQPAVTKSLRALEAQLGVALVRSRAPA
jgi:DNA-binding transcriptional LysR family regulator